jgi:hypothetical protein
MTKMRMRTMTTEMAEAATGVKAQAQVSSCRWVQKCLVLAEAAQAEDQEADGEIMMMMMMVTTEMAAVGAARVKASGVRKAKVGAGVAASILGFC